MKGLKAAGDHFPSSLEKAAEETPLNMSAEKTSAQISSEVSDKAKELLTTAAAGPVNASIDTKKPEPERNLAGQELRKLNQRMADMVEIREKELAGEITEGHLHTSLAGMKLINDQFNFIWKISEDLLKTLRA